MKYDYVIITLTRNRVDKLTRLLNQLRPLLDQYTTLAILNQGSTDGTRAYLNTFSDIDVYHSPINLGVNAARQYLVDRYLLPHMPQIFIFLDDDIQITDPRWIHNLTAPIRANAADITGVEGMTITDDYLTLPETHDPDYVGGGMSAVNAEVFSLHQVAFDIQFFPYFGDADFCTQAQAQSLRIRAVPDAGLYHEPHEGDSNLFEMNRARFRAKWPRLPHR